MRDMNNDMETKPNDVVELLAKIFKNPDNAKKILNDYKNPVKVNYKISTNVLKHFKDTYKNKLVQLILKHIENLINVVNEEVDDNHNLNRQKNVITSTEIYNKINNLMCLLNFDPVLKQAMKDRRRNMGINNEDDSDDDQNGGALKTKKKSF